MILKDKLGYILAKFKYLCNSSFSMGDFKKGVVIFMINILIILSVSIVSAGFFDFISEGLAEITGKATSQTTSLTLTIGNTAPNLQLLVINSTDEEGGNYTNETLFGSFVPADDDPGENDLMCNFRWFKDGVLQFTFINIACDNATRVEYVLTSANTSGGENWSFEGMLNDQGSSNSSWIDSINLTIVNTPVDSPIYLSGPLNNSLFYDTSGIPDVNWSNTTDADNDTIYYYLEIDDNPDFSSPTYANSAITETANVTEDSSVTGLSLNTDYWWRVLAYDDDNGVNSSWSEVRNFTYSNTVPNAPTGVTINTTDIGNYTNESLWCGFTPNDPDPGETDLLCNFDWIKNNASDFKLINVDCTDGTFTQSELTPENTSRGDEWVCGVQVNDGNQNTSWVNSSSSLVILNSIPYVWEIDFNISLSVTEDQPKVYYFSFLANDSDGLSDLGSSATEINGNISRGATSHGNTSCQYSGDVTGYSNYTCNITLLFYDPAGVYDVYVSLKDAAGAYVQNSTKADLDQTTSVAFNVSSMTFGTVVAASTNQTPSNNPFVLRNIGNDPINDSNINVTAIDILGDTDDSESIPTVNFTVDIESGGPSCSDGACIECDQTFLPGNDTTWNITGAILDIGPYELENLYFCLTHVPDNAGEQDYTTDGNGEKWTVSIG